MFFCVTKIKGMSFYVLVWSNWFCLSVSLIFPRELECNSSFLSISVSPFMCHHVFIKRTCVSYSILLDLIPFFSHLLRIISWITFTRSPPTPISLSHETSRCILSWWSWMGERKWSSWCETRIAHHTLKRKVKDIQQLKREWRRPMCVVCSVQ